MRTPEIASGGRFGLRLFLSGAVALAIGAGALLQALVADANPAVPGIAERLWPSHPKMLVSKAMRSLGAKAASGDPVDPSVRASMARVARVAPFAPEPFLLAGAEAQMAGREADARRMFETARARDPRSPAARYFLSDLHLRAGRLDAGLGEALVMSRLVPGSAEALIPALASFALSPQAIGPLRRFMRQAPDYAPAILGELATDGRNADTILALAGDSPPPGGWQARLAAALVESGEYIEAHRIWARLAGVEAKRALFNPGFAAIKAPPPFNWEYAETGGLVDPTGKGAIDVVYYGREDVALVRQTLVLPAGNYRLSMKVSGDRAAEGLSWRLLCLPSMRVQLDLPLRRAADGPIEGAVRVPAGCAGQILELRGSAAAAKGEASVTIDALRLDAVSGR